MSLLYNLKITVKFSSLSEGLTLNLTYNFNFESIILIILIFFVTEN